METLENIILTKQYMPRQATLKDLKPFIVVIEQQNNLNANNVRHLNKIMDILDISINNN